MKKREMNVVKRMFGRMCILVICFLCLFGCASKENDKEDTTTQNIIQWSELTAESVKETGPDTVLKPDEQEAEPDTVLEPNEQETGPDAVLKPNEQEAEPDAVLKPDEQETGPDAVLKPDEQETGPDAVLKPEGQETGPDTVLKPDEQETGSDVKPESSSEGQNPPDKKGYKVAIDAGHQLKGNSEKEPIGPGAEETKNKVTSGTKGVATGLYEYELNLIVAKQLNDELIARGYETYMVREQHDVDLSNAERATMANEWGADIFIRIHANGSDNHEVYGAMALCPAADNPYCSNLYEDSRELSDCVLSGLITQTGTKNRGVSETNTMSGINWCQVPVTIIEMGFMTNESEDKNMASSDYQKKLVTGMADGIDTYFD